MLSAVLCIYVWLFGTDPVRGSIPLIRILLFSSVVDKMPTIFFPNYCLKVLLHQSSKIKSQKDFKNCRNQGFFLNFCGWWRLRIRIRANSRGFFPWNHKCFSVIGYKHCTRVGNFRQKNYSAEDGIDGTNGLFRGIPAVLRNRKL